VRRVALALGMLLLTGCPIPQAVPEVGVGPGGPLVPAPRIVPEKVIPASTFVDVSRGCPAAPQIAFHATISEFDAAANPEVRWFVDYDPVDNFGTAFSESIPFPTGSTDTYRPVTPLPFEARRWQDPAVTVQVVELVVSNGFVGGLGGPRPNRTPQTNHETQVFRWVVRYVSTGGACSFP